MTYLFMAALAVLALAWLLWPLLRRLPRPATATAADPAADAKTAAEIAGAAPGAQGRGNANIAAYESRLAELAAERAAGLLSAEEAEALRLELGARLLVEVPPVEAGPAASAGAALVTSGGSGKSTAMRSGAATAVPAGAHLSAATPQRSAFGLAAAVAVSGMALAAAWYWQAGSWRIERQVAAAVGPDATRTALAGGAAGDPAAAGADGAPVGDAPEVQAMVQRLAAKLETEPGNAEGWALLGRSYTVMTRYREAAEAFGKANGLSKATPNAEWLAGEGEALGLSRDRDLLGKPAQLFDAALAVDPGYGKALWYAALAAEQGGDMAAARTRFTALLRSPELPEEIRGVIEQKLAGQGAEEGAALASAPTSAGVAGAGAAVATEGAATGAADAAAGAPALRLSLGVELAPSLQGRVPAGAVLFVFAKAASGPPMPLAVQRLPGAKLPLAVVLDDTMGMMPSLKLSQFDRWVVTARYSAAGSVQAQPGDLEGRIEVTRAQAGQPLRVVIDRVLP